MQFPYPFNFHKHPIVTNPNCIMNKIYYCLIYFGYFFKGLIAV
jgi:hypothetical protein